MKINFWLDICALILDITIAAILFIRRSQTQKKNYRTSLFISCFILSFYSTILDLVLCLSINNLDFGTKNFAWLFTEKYFTVLYSSHFIIRFAYASIFLLYIYHIIGKRFLNTVNYLAVFTPVAITALMITYNMFSQKLFYFTTATFKFTRKPLIMVINVLGISYFYYIFFHLLRYKKNATRQTIFSIILLMVMSTMASIVQGYTMELRIDDFINTLSILIVYLCVESPNDYLDNLSCLENKRSFDFFIHTNLITKNNIEILLMTINNENIVNSKFEKKIDEEIITSIANFLRKISKKNLPFRLNKNTFAYVSAKTTKENNAIKMQNIYDEIRERFKKPFNCVNHSHIISYSCTLVSSPKDFKNEKELESIIKLSSEVKQRNKLLSLNDLDMKTFKKNETIKSMLSVNLESIDQTFFTNLFTFEYVKVYNSEKNIVDTLDASLVMKIKNDEEDFSVREKEFIPYAEKNGSIKKIFELELHAILEDVETSKALESGIENIIITLPSSELFNHSLEENIKEIFSLHSVPAKNIIFALLEESIISYERYIENNLRRLSKMGFRFALKNFGNGYTNINRIASMPLSIVYIDKEITEAFFNEKSDTPEAPITKQQSLFICSCNFIKTLNYKILIKHIETEEEMNFAKDNGCSYMEGFYFSKPLERLTPFSFGRKQEN